MATATATRKTVKASMMNAIHDLPLAGRARRGLLQRRGPGRRDREDAGHRPARRRSSGAARQHLHSAPWSRSTSRAMRPVPHVRVGHHEARGRVQRRGRPPAGQDRGARLRHVDVRDRHRSQARHLRARAAQEQADRGEPVQRLALHDAEDAGRLPEARRRSSGSTPARTRSASRRCARRHRRR